MNTEKKIVLITGASGRIGSAVMQRLSQHFSDVVGFDRLSGQVGWRLREHGWQLAGQNLLPTPPAMITACNIPTSQSV